MKAANVLTREELAALDTVCTALRRLAGLCEPNVHRLEVTVCQDGRIELRGEDGPFTRWTVRGDVEPGSTDPLPSAALAAVRVRR